MFERFTDEARLVVVQAQAEARSLAHGWIGTEHLLLAALRLPSPLAEQLGRLGISYERAREEIEREIGSRAADERAALADLGIDVDEVRRRVEASFGPGALDLQPRPRRRGRPWRRQRSCGHGRMPFTARAKKSLELALREAIHLRSGEIATAHLVLGILREGDGLAVRVAERLGGDRDAVRRVVLHGLGRAA